MRAAPAGRRSSKVVAMAGAETAVAVATRWALAVPTMYAVVSFNEYVTHRWFQHAEFNKTDWMKALWCKVTGAEVAPKCDGGGHIEHHAETLDDMSLKTDPKWLKSEPATGTGVLTEDVNICGAIHRADVASLVVKCVLKDSANGKVLSCVDKEQLFDQPAFEEFAL